LGIGWLKEVGKFIFGVLESKIGGSQKKLAYLLLESSTALQRFYIYKSPSTFKCSIYSKKSRK